MSHLKIVVNVVTDSDDFSRRRESMGAALMMAEQLARVVIELGGGRTSGTLKDGNGNTAVDFNLIEVRT